ncbi:MAG: 1-acyl-sn-glycerol-3-phosphate acyltransferase [Bdellovibrionales bacterium]|jgi:1-acyl-sn-glycerol-3-phosphate acyltransferase|nr:1-acyl-sn-glycerol-3-phosphate acyltransferase [Bdellovibrionales bacterium]
MKDWTYENEQWTRLPTYLKHLPLFTRQLDLTSIFFRLLWSVFLQQIVFKFYIRLKIKGQNYHDLFKQYPKMLVISNHSSHLDATSIAASIPKRYWVNLYIAAAKDYFFSNPFFTFFSQHCLGAIPIDRKDRKGEAINLIVKLLTGQEKIWLILFPEGTRSSDGKIQEFKRGVGLFSRKTKTPILFLYLDGNRELMPKGSYWPKPGTLTIHVGPVHQPGPIEDVYLDYKTWVKTVNPNIEFDQSPSFSADEKSPQSPKESTHED